MKILSKHLSLISFALVLIFAAGCGQRPASSGAAHGFMDSIAVDSLTLWSEQERADRGTTTVYIMDSLVPVYALRGDHLYLDTVLKLADSVAVTKNKFKQYFTAKYYPVSYRGRQGYIMGTSMAFGLLSDFDNNGKSGKVLYGYRQYLYDSIQDIMLATFSVKFISAAGTVTELHDTACGDIVMNEVKGVRLSKNIHCYELTSGYPECGYPQYHFIIAYGHDTAEFIHRTVTSISKGSGDFCEFYYPSDKAHHTDTIYISHKAAVSLTGRGDSMYAAMMDSTILYLHNGKWGRTTYHVDTVPTK